MCTGTRKRSPSTEDREVTHTQKKQRLFEEEKLTTLLESLEFDGMESRLQTISPAHAETCHWIFSTPEYLRWQDDTYRHGHHGLLWIKGHPGSGKSTLMKHALAAALENAAAEIIVHFFFDAQAPRVLEQCVEGMYRSLLYQILQACPRLTLGLRMPAGQDWHTEHLKNMLRNVVQSLKPEDSLACYIDALDECIGDEIRDAVAFFEDLGDLVTTDNVRFRICMSSRHFPHITMHKHEELRLDTQMEHLAGIVQYSRTKLGWLDLADSTMHAILTEIRSRCAGVFFWAALVIKILKERYDCGATHTELMLCLEQVPDGLEQLFARILKDPDEALIACFQWLLFLEEPTQQFRIPPVSEVPQLYFAIKASIGQLTTGERDHDAIDTDGMERFIRNSSRGLIESTSGNVRFVHESIQEYLWAGGLARLINIEQSSLKGALHSRMAQSCLAYLHLDASKYLRNREQNPTRMKRLYGQSEFPLLDYASRYVLQHIEVAYQEGSLEPEAVWHLPLELLVYATNCRRPRSPTDDEQIFFCGIATLLYLLLRSGCRGLAKTVINRREKAMFTAINETRADVNFDIDAVCGSHHGTALNFAVTSPDVELVRTLLDQGAATNGPARSRYRPRLLERVMGEYFDVWILHFDPCARSPEDAVEDRKFLSLLNETARVLLDYGAPVDEWETHSPLHWAVLSSNTEMVRTLLEHGASVNARYLYEDTPLIGAAQVRPVDEMMMEYLLQCGADVNAVVSCHYLSSAPNALIFACETDQENAIRLLLQHGADPHHRTKYRESASFEDYLFKPDDTALGVALAKRNLNVARILWQAENTSPTTVDSNGGSIHIGERSFVCSGRAKHFWDDTKSESSTMSERKPSSRRYAKYKGPRLEKTTSSSDYAASKSYWQVGRDYSRAGNWTWLTNRITRSASI